VSRIERAFKRSSGAISGRPRERFSLSMC
jgi:hypothetical protein